MGLTYEELWMEDVSRKTKSSRPLFPGFKAILAIEKETLQPFFEPFCERAGIPLLVMMAGNCSFSSIEALLNRHFRNYEGSYTPTESDPLHLFVLSDFDYAGYVPVMGGVLEQFKRYLNGKIVLHRVGIEPAQVQELGRSVFEAGYIFEYDHNSAYEKWAQDFGYWIGGDCYGVELEALTPSDYVPYLVEAIVEAAGGDEELKKRLSEMAEPDWYSVRGNIQGQAYDWSELWKRLAALYDWSQDKRYGAERPIDEWVSDTVGNDYDDESWRNREDIKERVVEVVSEQAEGITSEAFVGHVQESNYGEWRPVGSGQANSAVVELFLDEFKGELGEEVERLDEEEESFILRLDEVFVILAEDGLEL